MMSIDIRSESVILLELARVLANAPPIYHIKSFAIEPIADHAILENKILDMDSVAETLYKTVLAAKTESTQVAIAVPDALVFKRILQIPSHFKEEEILEQIEMEAERYLPHSFEDLCFDFQTINSNDDSNSNRSQNNLDVSDTFQSNAKIKTKTKEVLLVAARVETVETYVEVLELAGLKAAVIDVESMALERGSLFMREHFSDLTHLPLSPGIDPVKIKSECPGFKVALGLARRTFDDTD